MRRRQQIKEKKENKLIKSIEGFSIKEKILLLIIVVIAIFIILNFIVIKPMQNKKNALNNEIMGLRLQQTKSMTSNELNNKLIGEYTKIQDNYAALLKKFKDGTTQYNLIEAVMKYANKAGVEIENISFEKGEVDKNYKNIIKNTGAFNVVGDYPNILNFVKYIQENNIEIGIENVNVYKNNLQETNNDINGGYIGKIEISYFKLAKGAKGNE